MTTSLRYRRAAIVRYLRQRRTAGVLRTQVCFCWARTRHLCCRRPGNWQRPSMVAVTTPGNPGRKCIMGGLYPSEAPASRSLHQYLVSGLHRTLLSRQVRATVDKEYTGRTGFAAQRSFSLRMKSAGDGVQQPILAGSHPETDALAVTTAVQSFAARARHQLLAREFDRYGSLEHLHRYRGD